MALMTAIVKQAPQPGVEIKQIPIPSPVKEELLIEVVCASLCGTDIGIYDWSPWAQSHINPPIVIGHEVVGKVIEVNTPRSVDIKVGDIVSSETHIYCGNCQQCNLGNQHICENLELFGIGRNGGFADFATIPIRTSWKNSPTLDPEIMSIQEPLGNAVHLITKAEVANKRILILGLGPVGLCAGAIAPLFKAKEIVAIEKSEYRRKLGKVLGLHYLYETLPTTVPHNFDIILEMSGDSNIIESSFEYLAPGGIFVAFGIPKNKVTLDWGSSLINKETTIKSVFGRKIWETWHEVQNILLNTKIDLRPLITHRYTFNQFEEAISCMKSGECGKIILYPEK